jgi:hypothetical protein
MAARTTRKRARVEHDHLETRPVRKSKRRATENSIEAISGGAVKPSAVEVTTPSTAPTEYSSVSPSSKKQKQEAVHADSDSEYETVKILKGHPSLRDSSELPIIAQHAYSGERKILWAKMDTGADVNVIAAKVVERLGLSSKIIDSHIDLSEIGGNDVEIDRKITINFWAGRKNHHCQNVEFFIPKETQDTDTDGLPDVLLGLAELRKHHMITIDPDFANEPEEGLEVVAKRASDEVNGEAPPAIFLGKKYPQVVKR